VSWNRAQDQFQTFSGRRVRHKFSAGFAGAGAGYAAGGVYNPATGGFYEGGAAYNPYLGLALYGQRFYNPCLNAYGGVVGYYNPYLNTYGYQYRVAPAYPWGWGW
jgi:hypothetical protein